MLLVLSSRNAWAMQQVTAAKQSSCPCVSATLTSNKVLDAHLHKGSCSCVCPTRGKDIKSTGDGMGAMHGFVCRVAGRNQTMQITYELSWICCWVGGLAVARTSIALAMLLRESLLTIQNREQCMGLCCWVAGGPWQEH